MPHERLPRWLWVVGGCLLLILSILTPQAALAEGGTTPEAPDASTADHSKFPSLQGPFESPLEVTQACLECHNQAADQVMQTIHWTWEYQDPVSGKTLGKKHDINNFCVAVTSNWARCTSCHAGYGWKDAQFDFNDAQRVDCLVCHDTTGTYKKFPTAAGFPVSEPKEFPPGSGKIWTPPDLAYIAQHVGKSSRTTCGSCHFYGGGGDGVKHGDMDSSLAAPPKEVDVHMSPQGANMSCSDCHAKTAHQIGGSRYQGHPADPHGKDLPVSDGHPTTCQSCHGNAPMHNAKLNDHVDKVACQTCHIPAFARKEATKTFWDWSQAGQDLPINNPHVYLKIKGKFVYERNVIPDYAWYNGKVRDRYLIGDRFDPSKELELNPPAGDINDPNAKIFPFKIHHATQPYDKKYNILLTPHTYGPGGYWSDFDWDKALRDGAEAFGLPYSGDYGFARTAMYWPITHMVAPASEALQCNQCHTPDGSPGRLDWKALGYPGDPMIYGSRKATLETANATMGGSQ